MPALRHDMPAQELRLHLGEMTAQEERTARAAIGWANAQLWDTIESLRRERIATAALQGLLASQVPGCTWGHERAAVESVEYADALIAALDGTTTSQEDKK